MDEIVKHINDTNASYRPLGAGDAKNTDLFLDNEHYQLFEGAGEHITVRYHKENLAKAILFIASILPRKFDQSSVHCVVPYSKDFVINQLSLLDALFVEDGKNVETITQEWNARKDVPQKNGKIDTRFYFNGLLKDVIYTDSKGHECKGKFTIRNYFAGGYSELHIKKANDGIFDIEITNVNTPYNDGKEDGLEEKDVMAKPSLSLQQIFYGAPGTGKSHTIKEKTKESDVIRTTFHPDSDYSSFVGAYKPTMEEIDAQVVPVVVAGGITLDTNKGTYKEKRITYKFVKQAFLKAYLSAWKKYAEGDENGIAPQFLVIEEINRGNCAQIFGDLFQLLDRQDNGFSSYPIEADADLQREIAEAFKAEKDYMLTKELNLQGVVKDYVGNLAEDVKSGKILLLPSNFYIWATMNTSDQSLFPIDSAFKRRWEWHYVKIADAKKDYKIKCGDDVCDWWIFVQAVNEKIAEETSSDDKKLGYFFCKPQNEGEPIGVERFVSKVLFYLWNDVFKDGNTTDFNVSDNSNKQPSFDAFYNDDNTINIENVRKFLVNIVGENGLRKVSENDFEEYLNEDIEDGDGDGKDHTKYAINGDGRISKRKIAVELIKKYIDQNPTLSAEEVAATWKMLGNEINISYIVETQEDYNNDTRNTKDSRLEKIICNGEPLWIGTHGWGTVEKMNELKAALSKRNWGLSISEIQE